MLLDTKDTTLAYEGNENIESFWAFSILQETGKNCLGEMLMHIRNEIILLEDVDFYFSETCQRTLDSRYKHTSKNDMLLSVNTI